jgi:hypothetical protein
VKYAIAIREFFAALFGSKLLVQLRADLEEARRERDYFRGRNERLELMLLPQRTTPQTTRADWRTNNPGGVTLTGGRKSWAMIERENRIQQEAEAKAEAEAKKNSAVDQPAATTN